MIITILLLLLQGYKRVTKLIKRVKGYIYGKRPKKLELTALDERRMIGYLIEPKKKEKKKNEFSNYGTIYQPLHSGRIWHKVNF